MIELRNLKRDPSASHPDLAYFADIVIRVPGRDILQEECCLAPSVRNLLGTLLWEHRGENGASDNALLVGDCGVAGCCGVDFGVLPKGDSFEISWADEDELRAAVERASRERPDEPIFPNTFRVAQVSVQVPRDRFAAAVIRLAVRYLRRRAADGNSDRKAEEALAWCEERDPDLVRSVRSTVSGEAVLPFGHEHWTAI